MYSAVLASSSVSVAMETTHTGWVQMRDGSGTAKLLMSSMGGRTWSGSGVERCEGEGRGGE